MQPVTIVKSGSITRTAWKPRLVTTVLVALVTISCLSTPLLAQQFSAIGPLSFTKVFNGANPLPQTLTVTSTGANFNFSYAATTNTGGSWLSVANVSFNGCGLCGMPLNIRAIVNADPTLAAGTYTGQIVLTSQSGTITMTVPVSLTVAPAGGTFFDDFPGQVSFSLVSNGFTPPAQPIQIRNGGTGTLNWTLATSTVDGGSWLTASATSGTAPSTINITLVKTSLPGQGITPGTFLGKLVFQSASGNVSIPVSVVVGASVFRQVNAINFVKPFNGANPLPQILTAASTGVDFQMTALATTANGGAWLSVDNASFNDCGLCSTPQSFRAIVIAGPTLAVGTYTGQIVFTSRDGTQSITVPVTLTVTTGNVPFFDNFPGQVSFSLATNGFAPPDQEIDIRDGESSGTLNWSVAGITADGGNWLTISAPSGTAPSRISVGVLVANLPAGGIAPGTFIGELIFHSSSGNVTVPVSVVVGDSVFRQIDAISFTKPVNGANPLPQTLTAASTGTNFQFTVSVSTANGGAWLSVVNASFNACGLCVTPESFRAVVNAGPTLPVGSYTGQIVFTARDGTKTLTVPVTLTVADPAAGAFFDNFPGQVSFSLATGGTAPPSQTLQVRNAGIGTLSWTLDTSTADGGNWLNVSVQSGTAPSLVSVSITTKSLPGQGSIAGTFVGTLIFRTAGESVTVPVSVVVGDSVFRQVNAISFTKPVSGANPLPQTLTIASTGTNIQFTFSASTATGGNWLSVTNPSFNNCGLCSTPQNLTAVVNASVTMPVGTYTGQIVLTARDGSQTLTVPVTLTVGDPAAGPLFDNLPGQMSFSLQTSGATPPAQAVQVRNAGTSTLNWTLETSTADGGSWLTPSPLSGMAPSVVSVSLIKKNLPGEGLIAGTFVGELVFRASGQSITVPVSVVVADNAFRQVNAISFVKPVGLGANPLPQTLTIASTGTELQFTFSATTATGGNWLTVDNASFNNCALCSTPQNLTAVVNASATMAVGTYTGQIVITARDSTQSLTVPVTLTVADPAAGPFFDNIPGQMSFSLVAGSGNPTSRTIELRNAGSGTLNWAVSGTTSDGGAWLTSGPASGVTPATVTVGVVANSLPGQGLVPGIFTGELVFQASGGNVTVPVSVRVSPAVFIQRPALNFATLTPNTNPPSQNLDITSTGTAIQFTVSTATGAGGNWLSVSTPAACGLCTTPATLTVSINASGLIVGKTYTGQIVITARDSTEAMTVPVILMVGAPTPAITSLTPNTAQQGQTVSSLAIAGQNTHWVQGTTVASFGAGITVNSLTVNGSTSATANITVQNNATAGLRSVTMTTGSEVATLVNGFTVTVAPASVVSVTPNTGQQGQTLTSVAIVGQNTSWVQGSTGANFGAGITVNSLTVNSATSATANITVQNNIALGARTVTMTTGAQVATLANGFKVTAGTPTVVSVTPNTGNQGQTLTSVAIVGQNTNFVQGTTTAGFGAGITVNSLTVNSSTSATANITVQNNATLGARTVTMTTGAQVASLANGFSVTAGTATVVSVTPNTGNQGQTLTSVAIVGQNTSFVQGTTVASFGAGITVNSLTVNSATSATANITVQNNAALGPRTVTMTTGAQVATLANGFSVTAGTVTIVSVTPNTGNQGQTLTSVAIVGQNTSFVQGTTVASFGAGITVNSLTVNSAMSATANITVQNNAALGARTVTMTTGAQVATLANGFTVTAGTATVVSVTPNTGNQGQTLTSVAIVGQNTNFVQGTTTAGFGAGITVNSLTVNSATSATANITVQNNATLGARTVTMTTGAQVATLANGFTVTAGTPVLVTVTPNTGQLGQTSEPVTLTGQFTHFVQGTTIASFGTGITVNSLTVNSATSATANITIQNAATLGARTVTLTTGAEVVSLANGFTVNPSDVVSYNVLFGTQSYNVKGTTRTRLPWEITGIQVVFSRPITTGNLNSLGGLTATSLKGLGTTTLTWTITPVKLGNFVTTLAGSGANALRDATGVAIVGGTGFTQTLKVLLGDFNDDGAVSSADLVGVNNATVAPYNIFADINGDASVDINDVQVVRTRIGTSLP